MQNLQDNEDGITLLSDKHYFYILEKLHDLNCKIPILEIQYAEDNVSELELEQNEKI